MDVLVNKFMIDKLILGNWEVSTDWLLNRLINVLTARGIVYNFSKIVIESEYVWTFIYMVGTYISLNKWSVNKFYNFVSSWKLCLYFVCTTIAFESDKKFITEFIEIYERHLAL